MIFPRQCKEVGYASSRPCGDRVYFLSRYLVRETPAGPEIVEVTPDPGGHGLMRPIRKERVLAPASDVTVHGERVNIHNRALLVRLAQDSGTRCTVFTGLDEHMTFVFDPDPSAFQVVHVYDVIPPRPSLSSSIRELEEAGLFGDLDVTFVHHIHDISGEDAAIFPCRAAGFSRSLDHDRPARGERIAGCLTGARFVRESYGEGFEIVDICPLNRVKEEPFIARCCRKEREGPGVCNGKSGTVVHWGAGPAQIYRAACALLEHWRGPA